MPTTTHTHRTTLAVQLTHTFQGNGTRCIAGSGLRITHTRHGFRRAARRAGRSALPPQRAPRRISECVRARRGPDAVDASAQAARHGGVARRGGHRRRQRLNRRRGAAKAGNASPKPALARALAPPRRPALRRGRRSRSPGAAPSTTPLCQGAAGPRHTGRAALAIGRSVRRRAGVELALRQRHAPVHVLVRSHALQGRSEHDARHAETRQARPNDTRDQTRLSAKMQTHDRGDGSMPTHTHIARHWPSS